MVAGVAEQPGLPPPESRPPVAVAPAALELHGVRKSFGRRKRPMVALDGVSFSVAAGEFVTLIGPSGCGKSTLLRTVAGLLPVDAGEVLVAGSPPDQARRAKQFGLVPQRPALLPWRTVRQNVRLLTEVNKGAEAHATLRPDETEALLREVGLGEFLGAYPGELSGGMQQRVALVRAFALGAPILLMDEPFAALDEMTREDMRFLLLRLWEHAGPTVLFVTHHIPEAVILADRVIVMGARPGRILAQERVELSRPRSASQEDTPEFLAHVRRVRAALRGAEP